MLDFLQCEKNGFSPLKPMLNINNVAKFITFFTDGKTQLNFATDQNMGNKPILVQNFDEQPPVPLKDEFQAYLMV